MCFVGRGFAVWSRTRKPTVAAVTVIMDWVAHGGLGRMGLNHVKKAGSNIYVRFAVNPPRKAKYVARRLMARVGMKDLIKNSVIDRGEDKPR